MFRSLRHKILAGYVLLVLILAVVGIWSVYNFIRLSDAVAGITYRPWTPCGRSHTICWGASRSC